MQNAGPVQDKALSWALPNWPPGITCQVRPFHDRPKELPLALPTATQSVTVGQDTAVRLSSCLSGFEAGGSGVVVIC
jgi:hypothetical protein